MAVRLLLRFSWSSLTDTVTVSALRCDDRTTNSSMKKPSVVDGPVFDSFVFICCVLCSWTENSSARFSTGRDICRANELQRSHVRGHLLHGLVAPRHATPLSHGAHGRLLHGVGGTEYRRVGSWMDIGPRLFRGISQVLRRPDQ